MKKKKIGIFVLLMLLGAYSVGFAQEDVLISDKADKKSVQNADNNIQESSAVSLKNMDTMEKAHYAISIKDYQSAIVYLTNYITSKPKKYEAYKLRGECFYALRQYKLAQNDFQTAINLKASDDKFITGTKVLGAMVLGADKQEQYQNTELGNLYGMLMYAQKASNSSTYEASYQKAFEYNSHIYLPQPKKEDIAKINCPQKYGKVLNPQGVDEYIYGAIDDIENKNYSEAVSKSLYVIEKFPRYYLGYYLYGVALAGADQGNDAVKAFESALKYNPYDFESLASLGQIYYTNAEKSFNSADAEKSISYFKEASKYNPNCYLYYYYIGLNNLLMNDYESAISSFNSAIKYKSNDYNSMYYKLIAQYVQGDYNAVIDGTTRLLYRHVSNYNSVLYLRALSYYKLGAGDSALVDIERIHNNMNDIYNADLKNLTPKEQTLESYLYYLKAQILKDRGYGTKADLDKAYKNPIIAELARIESAMKQYSKSLNDSKVSMDEYAKYKQLYNNQLQIMLKNTRTVTYGDIDTQYDYIRTAFDNLGISFEYVNPDYKMVKADVNQKSEQVADTKDKVLKQATSPSETLTVDNKSSIAQMLASQSLNAALDKSSDMKVDDVVRDIENDSAVRVATNVESVGNSSSEVSKPKEAADVSEKVLPEIRTSEKDEDVVEQVQDIKDEQQKISDLEEKVVQNESQVVEQSQEVKTEPSKSLEQNETEKVKAVAEVEEIVKESVAEQDEKLAEVSTEKTPEASIENSIENSTEKTAEASIENPTENSTKEKEIFSAKETVQADEQISESTSANKSVEQQSVKVKEVNVVEKHANVNPADFNIVHKPAPEISEDDEVVVFEPPKTFMQDVVSTYDKDTKSDKNEVQKSFDVEFNTKNTEVAENKSLVVEQGEDFDNAKTVSESEQANGSNSVNEIIIPPEMDKVAQEVQAQKLLAQQQQAKALAEAELQKELSEKSENEDIAVVDETVDNSISEQLVSTDVSDDTQKIKKQKKAKSKKSKLEKSQKVENVELEQEEPPVIDTAVESNELEVISSDNNISEVKPKEVKKSWFSWFKLNKASSKSDIVEVSETAGEVVNADSNNEPVSESKQDNNNSVVEVVEKPAEELPKLREDKSDDIVVSDDNTNIEKVKSKNKKQNSEKFLKQQKNKKDEVLKYNSESDEVSKVSELSKNEVFANEEKDVQKSEDEEKQEVKVKEKSKFSFKNLMFWQKKQPVEQSGSAPERKVIKQLSK